MHFVSKEQNSQAWQVAVVDAAMLLRHWRLRNECIFAALLCMSIALSAVAMIAIEQHVLQRTDDEANLCMCDAFVRKQSLHFVVLRIAMSVIFIIEPIVFLLLISAYPHVVAYIEKRYLRAQLEEQFVFQTTIQCTQRLLQSTRSTGDARHRQCVV